MTRLEIVQLLADRMTEVNAAAAGLPASDITRRQLEEARVAFRRLQGEFTEGVFDETDEAFQQSAAQLRRINDQIAGRIAGNAKEVIGDIQRVVETATKLLADAAGGGDSPWTHSGADSAPNDLSDREPSTELSPGPSPEPDNPDNIDAEGLPGEDDIDVP